MGQVIPFPSLKVSAYTQHKVGYDIPLYSDAEIGIIIAAINIFGDKHVQGTFVAANKTNLKNYAPIFVIKCLNELLQSSLFSNNGKEVVRGILANVEEIKIAK
jgi:hypothetical protein